MSSIAADRVHAVSNGTVFARRLQAPNLGAPTLLPQPVDALDPLAAASLPHWRFRYNAGRLVEVSRRTPDGSFAPMRIPYGRLPTNGYVFIYADNGMKPTTLITPMGVRFQLNYDQDGMLRSIERVLDVDRDPDDMPTSVTIERGYGRVRRVRYWRGMRPACDAFGVHARVFDYDANGFLARVSYHNADGQPSASPDGITGKTYRRGAHGQWNEVILWDAHGTPICDWHGVARYILSNDANGLVHSLRIFDANNIPTTNMLGMHCLEWQYDHARNIIGTRGYDATNALIYDGPALAPELFERTWADALVMRERDELRVPIWSFVDYSELERALRRYQRRIRERGHTPYGAEQLRVLSEYIMQAHAGPLALMAARLCDATGLHDRRWMLRATLGTECQPRPDTAAARFIMETFLTAAPSNALIFAGFDQLYVLLTYAHAVLRLRPDIRTLHMPMLADSMYLAAMRESLGTNVWLPDATDVQNAVRTYAQKIRTDERMPRRIDLPSDRMRIAGLTALLDITASIMRQIWHHNARPVLYEESLEVTNLYQSLAPAGPLFTFDKEAAAAPASTNMLMLTATWTAYLELLDRMPLDPAWHAARRLLARCAGAQAAFLYAQNYTNTAEFLFGVALRLSPGEPDPYLRWARILLQREKYGQAVKTLSLYLEHNPSNETVHAFARECATNMQRHAQIAALEYERQRHPLGISNTMLLAQLYSDAGRISNALECAQWALDTAATNANELEWYAAFFARHGEFDRADSVYARLLECDPGNFNYWTSRAALAFDQDNGERAVAFLRHAADIDRQRLARLLSINKVVHAMHERGRTNLAAQLEQLLQPGGTVPSAETNPVNGNEP